MELQKLHEGKKKLLQRFGRDLTPEFEEMLSKPCATPGELEQFSRKLENPEERNNMVIW